MDTWSSNHVLVGIEYYGTDTVNLYNFMCLYKSISHYSFVPQNRQHWPCFLGTSTKKCSPSILAASTWSFTPINHGISKIHIHLCHVKQKYPQESSRWFVMQQEQTTASWSWSYLLYSKMWSPYPLKQGLKQILKNLIVDCFRSGLVEPRFWWGPHGRWWGLIQWWTPDQIGDRHVLGGQQGARVWGHLAF